jgi:hypothetical protein
MSWRFRKSFSPLPGVRITLSSSGISTSVGVGPFSSKGNVITANIPGTGIPYRHSFNQQKSTPTPRQFPVDDLIDSELNEIKSDSTSYLTTAGLGEFKKLLEQSRIENHQINIELTQTRQDEQLATNKFKRWKNGFLFKRLFKNKYETIKNISEDTTAKRIELEEQELLSRIHTEFELSDQLNKTFNSLIDTFSQLSTSQKIWDTVGERATNQFAERTTAVRAIDRKLVNFHIGQCELIDSQWRVPHLENANGGDIYLYPCFIIYFITSDRFALLEYKDIKITFTPQRFIEDESVPSDSEVVDSTWAKTNKDGSPDRRFKENYQIPVALYGKITLKSSTGLNEEYTISNVQLCSTFIDSWLKHIEKINNHR